MIATLAGRTTPAMSSESLHWAGRPNPVRLTLIGAPTGAGTITIAGVASAEISADRSQSQMVRDEVAGTDPLVAVIGIRSTNK